MFKMVAQNISILTLKSDHQPTIPTEASLKFTVLLAKFSLLAKFTLLVKLTALLANFSLLLAKLLLLAKFTVL